jgi:hypothetical protein
MLSLNFVWVSQAERGALTQTAAAYKATATARTAASFFRLSTFKLKQNRTHRQIGLTVCLPYTCINIDKFNLYMP